MSQNPWVVRHQPKTSQDIIGQDIPLRKLHDFLVGFKTQKKKAAFLTGPVGCGKTSSAIVLAKELGWELVEVNASDTRNADEIEAKIGEAARQQSLFFQGKLILVDEVDGISGQQDRGGIPALVKVIEQSAFPVVLTANDVEDSKFSPLKKVSTVIPFDKLNPDAVLDALERVCKAQGVQSERVPLVSLSHRCGGDVRAAINDLQSVCGHSKRISPEMVSALDSRNQIEAMEDALIKVFKVLDVQTAKSAFDGVGEDLDECMLWIEENLPKEYDDPRALSRACESLARSDVFRGRIKRWQYWRFLVYVSALMTAGVASAKDRRNKSQVKYVRSRRILSIYLMNIKNAKKKSIAKKIAGKTHASFKETMQQTIPFLAWAAKRNHIFADALSSEYGLDNEEREWLVR